MDGTVYPVHNNKFKFGTAGLLSTDAEMVVPKDLTNFAPTIDGTTDEWYAMDAEGWAKSAVTGKRSSAFRFRAKKRGRSWQRLYCQPCIMHG